MTLFLWLLWITAAVSDVYTNDQRNGLRLLRHQRARRYGYGQNENVNPGYNQRTQYQSSYGNAMDRKDERLEMREYNAMQEAMNMAAENEMENEYDEYDDDNDYDELSAGFGGESASEIQSAPESGGLGGEEKAFDEMFGEEGGGGEEERKQQYIAILLSWFLGYTGAGRFYVGDNWNGSIKLALFLFPCLVSCCSGIMAAGKRGGNKSMPIWCYPFGALSACGCCALSVWVMADIMLFAMNQIPDAEGRTLIPWWEHHGD